MFILFYDAVNWSTNSIICTLLCETYSIKEKFNVTLPTFSRYHLLWSVFFTLKTTAASWRSRASLSNMERAANCVHVRSLRTDFPLKMSQGQSSSLCACANVHNLLVKFSNLVQKKKSVRIDRLISTVYKPEYECKQNRAWETAVRNCRGTPVVIVSYWLCINDINDYDMV